MTFCRTTLKIFPILALIVFAHISAPKLESATDPEAEQLESKAVHAGSDWNAASTRFSIDLLTKASLRYQSVGDRIRASECLRKAARLQLMAGLTDAAMGSLKKAIELSKGVSSEEEAMALSLLASIRLGQGEATESSRMLDHAWDLVATSDSAATASVLRSLAELQDARQEFQKALASYQRSIDIWRKIGDKTQLAETLIGLSYIRMVTDDPLAGLANSEEAAKIYGELGDTRGTAIAHISKGHLLSVLGRKQEALSSYLAAKERFPDGLDQMDLARLLNGLGFIYEDLGEWKLSLENRRDALKIFEKEDYLLGVVSTLPSLIKLSNLIGEEDAASDYLNKIERLSRKLGDKFWFAIALEQVGHHYFNIGKDTMAKTYYRRCLPILRASKLHVEVSVICDKLGTLYARQGDLKLARKYYETSMALSTRIKSSVLTANTLHDLASLDFREGKTESSLELARSSIDATESMSGSLINSNLRTSYISTVSERYELYIKVLMSLASRYPERGYTALALQAAERSRARSMLENLALSQAHFTADADPQTALKENEIRTELNAKSDRLTELLSRDADRSETEKLDAEIGQLRNQLEEIKAELKRKSPIYSAIKDPPPFDVSELQAKFLDENSLLMEFSFGADKSFLWVVGKTGSSSYVLPPRHQIESRIERLRSLLSQNSQLSNESIDVFQERAAAANAEYLREAHALSNDLLGQAADELGGKRLIIVADGKMHYFPLEALPLPDSRSDDPILLTNEVIYEPSAAALMLIEKTATSVRSPGKDLFLVSDPVFSRSDVRLRPDRRPDQSNFSSSVGAFRDFRSLDSLPRLPASLDEANSIENVVGAYATTSRTGFAANRDNVLNSGLADYKVVHFATHGVLDEERPELSGIVLSLFDQAGDPQSGGFLRLQDVYGMNLNADLVVLSACDTGLGKEIKGEGIMSLNNAFLQAGARTVVSTLWKIEDTATKQLMTDLYRGMKEDGLTPSGALRRAKIRLRNDQRFSSPFFWASFTTEGDFRSFPHFSTRRRWTIFDFGVVLLSLCGIFLFRTVRMRKSQNPAAG